MCIRDRNNPSPLREDMPAGGTTNPYGTTKLMIEQILHLTHKEMLVVDGVGHAQMTA